LRHLKASIVRYPVAGVFRISRSALTEIPVVMVEISDGEHSGRAECRPYARYDETPQSVMAEIEHMRRDIESGLTIEVLQIAMSPGAARNAIDCALWDLKAKQMGRAVWEILGLPEPRPRLTAYTLSIDTPDAMIKAALQAKQYPLLKIKIGSIDGLAACLAVLEARSDAKLIIDANEALRPDELPEFQANLKNKSVVLIEQPLPDALIDQTPMQDPNIPLLCADESLHTSADLDKLRAAGYRAVNVKLDKTGGLTEGLALMQAAKARDFTVMAGCMVGSSLAMAPMMILESLANYIDLDGPLLLARDIENGLKYEGATVFPPESMLWG